MGGGALAKAFSRCLALRLASRPAVW